MENKYGVYQIVCKTTDYRYIGSTTGSFKYRWIDHRSLLRAGTHHSQHLQNAWNKYGEDDFLFLILDVVDDKEQCLKQEQHYLDSIDHKTLYNIRFKAAWHPNVGEPIIRDYSRKSSGMTGRKMSEESKRRMSESAKKRPYDEAMKQKLIKARSMIPPHSEETKRKISESNTGKTGRRHSEELSKSIGEKNRGTKRTKEQRERMSEAQRKRNQKGKKLSPESLEKRRETIRNKKATQI